MDQNRREAGLVTIDHFRDVIRNDCSLGLAKDSEDRPVMEHHLLKMIESGVLHSLKVKWRLDDEGRKEDNEGNEAVETLGYESLFLPFAVLMGGMVLAVVVAAVERSRTVFK